MKLQHLQDMELLSITHDLVQNERNTLTQILYHLREIETRKLFCDLKYQSLFEYCVKELKYSEGQAGRRIQAMRLLKELPHLEEKIQSGELGLMQLSQAQSYFRAKAKSENVKSLSLTEKSELIAALENKTSREVEKIILALDPELPQFTERERVISAEHTEVRFVMDETLKKQLEVVRSLLGAKAIHMSFAELIFEMARLAESSLRDKKFGKRTATPALESAKTITKSLKAHVWKSSDGVCTQCGSRHNLQVDHIFPRARGGGNEPENLRLLCFNCNQWAAINVFGIRKLRSEIDFEGAKYDTGVGVDEF